MNDSSTISLRKVLAMATTTASTIQSNSGVDSLPKLTSNLTEGSTDDATTIDTLCKEEERESRLSEQSTKARILMRAWLYKNVPESGMSSRNRRKIGNAALRLKPLGITIPDVRRVLKTVFNCGVDSGEVFCVASEVAECLLYPVEWAAYDAQTISVLSHLLTDLLGCGSVEILEKRDQLGWLLVDGSMGLPTPGLKQEKLLQKFLAKATKPSDHRENPSSLEKVESVVNQEL